ncbi:hypothetical protein [Aquimarina algiphila]|uniref:Uncharacterized protein n=1 Tax=Aquimarina algiphila TaxID=2047982 RepID=A0A554VRJ1_9FLAO|nr:hypothetical protein [Aquimarina algiphila]TSE11270.1 hypothetical protein FOF46_01180 [Aquimarina algiphila]
MAKAGGGGAAYQRLRRLDDGISQAAQYWGGIAARRNDAREGRKAALDEKKRQEKRAEAKAKEAKLAKIEGGLKMWDTKSKSLNEINFNALSRAKQVLGETAVKLDDPNLNPEERRNLQLKLDQLAKLPEMMHSFSDNVTKEITAYNTGVANGKIIKDENFSNKLQTMFSENKEVDMTIDDTGELVLAFKNAESDGIPEYISYSDWMSGKKRPTPHRAFNLAEKLTEDAKNFAVQENVSQTGFRTSKDRDISDDRLKDYAASQLFGEEAGGLSQFGYSFARQNLRLSEEDVEVIDDEERQMLTDEYAEMIKATKNLGDENTIDQRGLTGRINANEKKRANKAKENKDKVPLGQIRLKTDEKGNPLKSPGAEQAEGQEPGVYNFSLNIPIDIKEVGKGKSIVKQISRDPNGDIEMTIQEEILADEKGKKLEVPQTRERLIRDKNEISDYSRRMRKEGTEGYYDDLEDLDGTLMNLVEKNKEEQQAKSAKKNKKETGNDYGI